MICGILGTTCDFQYANCFPRGKLCVVFRIGMGFLCCVVRGVWLVFRRRCLLGRVG